MMTQQYEVQTTACCVCHGSSSGTASACLEGEGVAGARVADIDDVGSAMADVVVEENLDRVAVSSIKQQQLARAAALIAALPERVVVPDCKCPAHTN